ncbi:hypothetical protein FRB91_004037 [Serendipita sp. 411]|nr:hypothetical protein FRB91_004037 [Serendipita sp. 411]
MTRRVNGSLGHGSGTYASPRSFFFAGLLSSKCLTGWITTQRYRQRGARERLNLSGALPYRETDEYLSRLPSWEHIANNGTIIPTYLRVIAIALEYLNETSGILGFKLQYYSGEWLSGCHIRSVSSMYPLSSYTLCHKLPRSTDVIRADTKIHKSTKASLRLGERGHVYGTCSSRFRPEKFLKKHGYARR